MTADRLAAEVAAAGEVWQEADNVLLLCIKPGVTWRDFNGANMPWDAPTIAHPLRRLLDAQGNLVAAEVANTLTAALAPLRALIDERNRRADEWDAKSPDAPLTRVVRIDALKAALAEVLGDVRRWRPEDGDGRCQRCGRQNPVWFTDDALWNSVVGNEGGVLCPTCFMKAASAALGAPVWTVLMGHEGASR